MGHWNTLGTLSQVPCVLMSTLPGDRAGNKRSNGFLITRPEGQLAGMVAVPRYSQAGGHTPPADRTGAFGKNIRIALTACQKAWGL